MDKIPSKIVSGQTYVHVSIISCLPADKTQLLHKAEEAAGVRSGKHFNLIRFDVKGQSLALLNYPDFFEAAFPSLLESWKIDFNPVTVKYRSFSNSRNPPILHRKELFLWPEDERRKGYERLTKAAEKLGLFKEPTRIGYQRQWLELIEQKGYELKGHEFIPLAKEKRGEENVHKSNKSSDWQASRHLTALTRYGFSSPIGSLARHGFLDGSYSLFDYGCGRGDDLRGLKENSIQATGWDPFYAPNEARVKADIVNVGFVLNVIEDVGERQEALTKAWSLSERLMVVSVMLANQNQPLGEPYGDGVRTKRGTFQKYFTQREFRSYIEEVIDEKTIPVAPGVLYVFRDKDMEQRFLLDRYSRGHNALKSASIIPREKQERVSRNRSYEKYSECRHVLDSLWGKWIELGRKPDKSEIEDLVALLKGFGSVPKVFRFIEQYVDLSEVADAAVRRLEDLKVYFALNQFEQRKAYKSLDKSLQRDVRHFFGNYTNAEKLARELLFQIAEVEAIEEECRKAAELGCGWLEGRDYLQLHVSLVEKLPPLLRVYLGCAFVLYGDYQSSDLIKIHIQSGKVSLMRFDDFEGKPLSRMVERVKIKLRQQDIDYFSYGAGEHEAPYLYRKSRYINEEFLAYPEQRSFDEELEATGLFDFSNYGPEPAQFLRILGSNSLSVEGFHLVKKARVPTLGEKCGEYLTYRQFIECGETQALTALPNLPQKIETYGALLALAVNVLDPVIDYYGMIDLTYGFCSHKLATRVPGGISPNLDQHAAHERNLKGNPICDRLGAAVDFIVADECMLEVAQWVVQNAPFDRLYFYGKDRPIHVSYGPDHSRQVVVMKPLKAGRLVPSVCSLEKFCLKN